MEAIGTYLLRSSVWLTGFALVYMLFLRNERFFLLNRLYLSGGMILSLVFPLFTWHYTVIIPVVPAAVDALNPMPAMVPVSTESSLSFYDVLQMLYVTGLLFLASKTLIQLFIVGKEISQSGVKAFETVKIIHTNRYPASFSFFNFVFVNPSIAENEIREIIHHEREHIAQRHWIDLMLLELACLVQWFNPMVWLYGRLIRQNHEYLADERALQRSQNPAVYRAALLNQMFGGPVIPLTNSFNYSLNKKRFYMMKKTISSPIRKLKLLLVLPLIAGVFYAFAAPEYRFVEQNESLKQGEQIEYQSSIAKGKVVDEAGNPLVWAGVRRFDKDGQYIGGTVTNESGNFELMVQQGATLSVALPGYQSQTVNPESGKEMLVVLKKGQNSSGTLKSSSDVKSMIIKGKVVDEAGNSLSLANVIEVDQNGRFISGTVTDQSGIFIIKIKGGTTLEVGFSGYQKQKVNPEIDKEMRVVLKMDPNLSGDQKGSSDKQLSNLNIRSTSSLDNSKPLIVIDGKIVENQNLDKINPETIESISVLKNESATILYGEKGKNGVILITMKKAPANGEKGSVTNLSSTESEEVFLITEEQATFLGGDVNAFRDWIAKNIKYPTVAAENGISGKVYMQFAINSKGAVVDVKVVRGVDPSLDKEAVRVVMSSPLWEPAKQRGTKVKQQFTVPVNFNLPDNNTQGNSVKSSGISTSGNTRFFVVEEMPSFPGGAEALSSFINTNLKYPPIALENGIQGKVFVIFVVSKTGKVTEAKIVRGVDPSLDKEAVRIVESMPIWTPGKQNGEYVEVMLTVPIDFKIPADYHPISQEKLRTSRATEDSYTKTNQTLQLIIVPNPTKDEATMTLEGSESTNILEVSVYDMFGKLIKKESKNGPTFKLSAAKFPTGTYIVVAKDGETQFTGQLIVNH